EPLSRTPPDPVQHWGFTPQWGGSLTAARRGFRCPFSSHYPLARGSGTKVPLCKRPRSISDPVQGDAEVLVKHFGPGRSTESFQPDKRVTGAQPAIPAKTQGCLDSYARNGAENFGAVGLGKL